MAKLAQLTRSSLGLEVPSESAEQLLERQYKETQDQKASSLAPPFTVSVCFLVVRG